MEMIKGTMEIMELNNYETIKENVLAQVSKYKGVIVTNETEKELKDLLDKKLKKERAVIKKGRAELNKILKNGTKAELDKLDLLINAYDEVIKPIELGIDKFKEDRRVRRLNIKKNKLENMIKEVNETLNISIKGLVINKLDFNEAWANKSDDMIEFEINEYLKKSVDKIEKANERIELLNMKKELLENKYELKSEIDIYKINNLYEISKDDAFIELEKIADNQKKIQDQIEQNSKIETKKTIEVEDKESGEIIEQKEKGRKRKIRIDIMLETDSDTILEEIEQLLKEKLETDKILVKEL